MLHSNPSTEDQSSRAATSERRVATRVLRPSASAPCQILPKGMFQDAEHAWSARMRSLWIGTRMRSFVKASWTCQDFCETRADKGGKTICCVIQGKAVIDDDYSTLAGLR